MGATGDPGQRVVGLIGALAGAPAGVAKAVKAARKAKAPKGKARLVLRASRKVASGGRAQVPWTMKGARSASTSQQVTRWVVYLDGRKVRTVARGALPVMRKRIFKAGMHRWKVEGRSASGRRVLRATKAFRVR